MGKALTPHAAAFGLLAGLVEGATPGFAVALHERTGLKLPLYCSAGRNNDRKNPIIPRALI